MNEDWQEWSPVEKVLLAVAVLVAGVVFLLVYNLDGPPRSETSASDAVPRYVSPAEAEHERAEELQEERRDLYRECLRNEGGTFRYRGRFSRPDMDKIREAQDFCQTLMDALDAEPTPAPEGQQPALPVA